MLTARELATYTVYRNTIKQTAQLSVIYSCSKCERHYQLRVSLGLYM